MFLVEGVVDVGMDRGELLQRHHLSESEHRPLSSPEREVTIFNPIISPPSDLLFLLVAELVYGRPVGAQPVGSDRLGRVMRLQRFLHEPQGRCLVAGLGDVASAATSGPPPQPPAGAFALTVP